MIINMARMKYISEVKGQNKEQTFASSNCQIILNIKNTSFKNKNYSK